MRTSVMYFKVRDLAALLIGLGWNPSGHETSHVNALTG
jgi:hypothetical protein